MTSLEIGATIMVILASITALTAYITTKDKKKVTH
jgi:hypothetical protein